MLCGLFSSCGERSPLSVSTCGLLTVVASLIAEHRPRTHRLQCCGMRHVGSVVVVPGFYSTGATVVVHGFSCSVACEIFLDEGLNLCVLQWQVDSLPLTHLESPCRESFY